MEEIEMLTWLIRTVCTKTFSISSLSPIPDASFKDEICLKYKEINGILLDEKKVYTHVFAIINQGIYLITHRINWAYL